MILTIITSLLYFALFFLLITSVILLRNRYDLTPLFTAEQQENIPKISVCIPARNEADNVGVLLESLRSQNWTNFEVHVLDDRSSDQTFEVAESYRQKNPEKFFIYKGQEKPSGWFGKAWACHQLQQKCDGDILLFLDADTRLQPETLKGVAASFRKYDLDMLTVWPLQQLETFWENVLIPLVYYALMTLLPAIYVYRDPRWMPAPWRKFFRSKFAAANGQCLAFKKEAYETIGGHESVKDHIVEDVQLAKRIKQEGFVLRMFSGIGSISCRMYRNQNEIFDGFRKNFLAGFNNSLLVFILSGLLHLIVYILPFITIIAAFFTGNSELFFLSAASISLILIHRLIISIWYDMNPIYAFTHPVGVLWFQLLGVLKIMDHISDKPVQWKGRDI